MTDMPLPVPGLRTRLAGQRAGDGVSWLYRSPEEVRQFHAQLGFVRAAIAEQAVRAEHDAARPPRAPQLSSDASRWR